jgi:hypothetical protein
MAFEKPSDYVGVVKDYMAQGYPDWVISRYLGKDPSFSQAAIGLARGTVQNPSSPQAAMLQAQQMGLQPSTYGVNWIGDYQVMPANAPASQFATMTDWRGFKSNQGGDITGYAVNYGAPDGSTVLAKFDNSANLLGGQQTTYNGDTATTYTFNDQGVITGGESHDVHGYSSSLTDYLLSAAALTGAAVPGLSPFLTAINLANAVANKNPTAALAAASGLPGVSDLAGADVVNAAKTAGQASNLVNAVESGNVLGAIGAGAGLTGTGGVEIGDTGVTVSQALTAAKLANAVESGNMQGAVLALESLAKSTGADNKAKDDGTTAGIQDIIDQAQQAAQNDGTTAGIQDIIDQAQKAEQPNLLDTVMGIAATPTQPAAVQDVINQAQADAGVQPTNQPQGAEPTQPTAVQDIINQAVDQAVNQTVDQTQVVDQLQASGQDTVTGGQDTTTGSQAAAAGQEATSQDALDAYAVSRNFPDYATMQKYDGNWQAYKEDERAQQLAAAGFPDIWTAWRYNWDSAAYQADQQKAQTANEPAPTEPAPEEAPATQGAEPTPTAETPTAVQDIIDQAVNQPVEQMPPVEEPQPAEQAQPVEQTQAAQPVEPVEPAQPETPAASETQDVVDQILTPAQDDETTASIQDLIDQIEQAPQDDGTTEGVQEVIDQIEQAPQDDGTTAGIQEVIDAGTPATDTGTKTSGGSSAATSTPKTPAKTPVKAVATSQGTDLLSLMGLLGMMGGGQQMPQQPVQTPVAEVKSFEDLGYGELFGPELKFAGGGSIDDLLRLLGE